MSFIQWLFVTESVAVSVIKLVLTLGAVMTAVMALALTCWHRDENELDVATRVPLDDRRLPRWLLVHSRPRR